MLVCAGLLLLMLVSRKACSVGACPHLCTCTLLGAQRLKVNCSFKGLQDVPSLPDETEELYLQNNLLTSVSPGTFDSLQVLTHINLSSNPWHCDCNILYLKMWLEEQATSVQGGVLCSTPNPLSRRPAVQLTGNEFTSCSKRRIHCSDFIFNDGFLFALVFLLLVLLIVCILTTKALHFKMEVSDHTMEMEQIIQPTVSEARKRRTFTIRER